jgi:catechol 2,3-dioxygenase-like lactoylglutathione lyase family enzyme
MCSPSWLGSSARLGSVGAMSTIAELVVADDVEAWRELGFAIDGAGCAMVGSVRLRFEPPDGDRRGMVGWVLAGVPDEDVRDVDGIPTSVGDPPERPDGPADRVSHALGVTSIDHVVVATPDLPRTVAAIERSLGLALKRTRDGEAYGKPMRQAFFRMGEVVLEVVGPPEPEGSGGPARFFGIAFNLSSLDGATALGTDIVGPAKPAVQAGRSIATVRSAARVAVPVALMVDVAVD